MQKNVRAALASPEKFDAFCQRNGFVHRSIHPSDGFVERRELQLAFARAGAKDGIDVVYRSDKDDAKKYTMTIAFKDKQKAASFRLLA